MDGRLEYVRGFCIVLYCIYQFYEVDAYMFLGLFWVGGVIGELV